MTIPQSNGKTVLITGLNGYIASVLGELLLSKGYSLRGTIRRPTSVEPLLQGAYAPYRERIQIVQVPDMTISGAFDEAVKGVDGIFHTASPIDFTLKTYDDFVTTAVAGNESILGSALKVGSQLTAVVVTSSTIAIVNPQEDPEYNFTEKDYGSFSLEEAQKDRDAGRQSAGGRLYAASKIAADRIMWEIREKNKPPFAISAINPVVVIGPPAVLPAHPSALNETLLPVWKVFSGAATIPPSIGSGSYVDVRDVAREHVWAYENPSISDGERYIASAGKGPPQAASDVLRHVYKGTAIGDKIPVGNPGEGYLGYEKETGIVNGVRYPPGQVTFDGTKAEKVMGFKYIPFEQSVVDTAKALEPLLNVV